MAFCGRTRGYSGLVLAALLLAGAARARGQFLENDVEVLQQLRGEEPGEFFGYVANPLPDIDGDGAAELIVGAPFGTAGGANSGQAYVMSGRTGQRIYKFAGLPDDYFGSSVRHAGDVNGDGYADIIIGSPGQPFVPMPGVNGRAAVYSGRDGTELWSRSGAALDDLFGYSVAGLLDDLDGDGYQDVLVSANGHDEGGTNTGRIYIFSGIDGAELGTVDGPGSMLAFGASLTSLGDVDGDGKRDFAVGAPNGGTDRRGRGYIYSSASKALLGTCRPEESGVNLGWFFSDFIGDLDGDGIDDVYLGDFGDAALGPATGRAYVFSGATGATLRTWIGEQAGEGFGIGRGAGGDVNGDGRPDLYIAAWTSSLGAPQGGRGYVLSGADGAVLQTMTGTVPGATLGYDACSIPDVNDDGATDFVLTGAGWDGESIARGDGVAYILAGRPPALVGDVNCDGAVDFGDIGPFVLALSDPQGYEQLYPDCPLAHRDINGDGVLDFGDITPFVHLLSGR